MDQTEEITEEKTETGVTQQPEPVLLTYEQQQERGKRIGKAVRELKKVEWFEHAQKHMEAERPDFIEVIRNTPKGPWETVLIVSAGPSLEKTLPQLAKFCKSKQHRSRLVIISVGTALEPLLKNKIVPDIVTSIESKDLSPMFRNLPLNMIKKIMFVTPLLGNPVLCDLPWKESYVVCNTHDEDFDDEYNYQRLYWAKHPEIKPYSVSTGGSVANFSAIIAFWLVQNRNPRIRVATLALIGQDLAFREDGQIYSRFSRYGKGRVKFHGSEALQLPAKEGINPGEETHLHNQGQYQLPAWDSWPYVKGKKVGRVQSSEQMGMFRLWFIDFAQKIAEARPDIELMNCSEEGALIADIQALDSQGRVIEDLSKVPPDAKIFFRWNGGWPSVRLKKLLVRLK